MKITVFARSDLHENITVIYSHVTHDVIDIYIIIIILQIRLYAQYNDPNHVQAGTNVLVQAECYNKLAKDYFENSGIHVYLAYTLCLPLLFTVALVAMVRSMSVPITKKLSNSLGHPNVAGLVLMGVFLHILCLAMDVTAVYFMWQDRELRDMPSVDLHRHLNFFATWVTLGLDLIVSLLVVLCAMYLQCHNTQNHTLFKKVFQWVFSPLFYLIFGEYDQEAFWDAVYTEPQPQPAVARDQGVVVIQHGASEGITNAAANPDNATANPTITNPVDNPVVNTVVDNTAEKSKRQHIAWIVCFMQLAPFFSLASHIGYIFAAWLTNPYKATSVSLIILGVSVCMYMMFRQCYIANKNATWTKCEKWFLLCSPLCQVFKCVLNCLCLCLRKKYFPQERQRDSYETLLGEKRKVDKIFDTSAFCVAFAWGWPIVGTMVFLFCAFYKLPVASYNLPLYLLNAFQVFIVVITLLITYKILSINDPVLHGFLRNMKEAYLRRAPGGDRNVRMEGDEVEEGANLIGELVGVVVHELKRERSNEN